MKRVTVYSSMDLSFREIGKFQIPLETELIIIGNTIYKVDEEFPNEAYPVKNIFRVTEEIN